ncbi:MAG TPA: hypothetical protein VF541_10400 [Longimicrobium sp.]
MRVPRITIALLVACVLPHGAGAQARVVSAPADDELLTLTQGWGARSALGDLRAGTLAPDDVELRLWAGYGLEGTYGLVLRRRGGEWSGWKVRHRECRAYLPETVGDTLSDESRRRYRDQARRECAGAEADSTAEVAIVSVDSLEVIPVAPEAELRAAWDDAMAAGVATLPPTVPRPARLDGETFVVELRRGSDYRASVIEYVDEPETEADRQVQHVFKAVYQRLAAGS